MEEQYGFIEKQIGNEKAICLNDTKLVSTISEINRLGTYVIGNTLYHNGVALLNPSNLESTRSDSTCKFGDIDLDTQGKICINITIADYNKLLSNKLLTDYKPYDRFDVYNLVENPANAELIHYTEEDAGYRFETQSGSILWKTKTNVIYNNIIGLDINPHVYNHMANLQSLDSPYVDLRYFNPVITAGDKINLEFRVTDQKNSVFNYDTIGPVTDSNGNNLGDGTYTVIIKTEDTYSEEYSDQWVIKSMYSGVNYLDTPEFHVNPNDPKDRETWFSIQCIDSRGVASAEQYLDVYVRANAYQQDYFPVTDEILTEYGVTYHDINEELEPTTNEHRINSYKNKEALSRLFRDIKNGNFDYHDLNHHEYNGVILPTHKYYLDYHKDISKKSSKTFTFLHFSDVHACAGSIERCKDLMLEDDSIKFSIFTGDLPGSSYSIGEFGSTPDDVHVSFDSFHSQENIANGLSNKLLAVRGNHDVIEALGAGIQTYPINRSWRSIAYFRRLVTNPNVIWGDEVIQDNWNDSANNPVNWSTQPGSYNTFTNPNDSSIKKKLSSSNWHIDYQISENSKLRIIGLDQYEYGQLDENGNYLFADYAFYNVRTGEGDRDHWYFRAYDSIYSTKQVNWFIDRLKELNENDYFLIALHTPPVNNTKVITNNGTISTDETIVAKRRKNKFCSSNLSGWGLPHISGDLFPEIVDTYKRKSIINKLVGHENSQLREIISDNYIVVNADFTNDSPATFLGYLCGHIHGDICEYHPNYPDQLILCIANANDLHAIDASPDMSDIFNYDGTSEHHKYSRNSDILINKITLDFNNKLIKIERIGENVCNPRRVSVSSAIGSTDYYEQSANNHSTGYIYPQRIRDKIEFPFDKNSITTNIGEQRYFLVTLDQENKIAVVNNELQITEVDLDYVESDAAELYRYRNAVHNGQSLVEFSNLLTIPEPDPNDILYKGDYYWYRLTTGNTGSEAMIEYYQRYLRTFKIDYSIDYYMDYSIDENNQVIDNRKPFGKKKDGTTSTHPMPDVMKGRQAYLVWTNSQASDYALKYTDENYRNGDYLIFPDHFTIDLNGSKFIAANTHDIDKGFLIGFYKNLDTHIISSGSKGYFEGLYKKFDFLKTHLAIAHDKVGEPSAVFRVMISRFCSIDNIDISGSIGYDCCVDSQGMQGGTLANSPNFKHKGRYIDELGEIVDLPEGVETHVANDRPNANLDSEDLLRIAQESEASYLAGYNDLVIKPRTISLGRMDRGSYTGLGKRYEIYVSYYDENYNFIRTIKSKLYYQMKPPIGARYVVFTGYGRHRNTGQEGCKASDWIRSISGMGYLNRTHLVFSIGLEFKNCYIHDCRTTAITNPQGKQVLYDNIIFERCASTEFLARLGNTKTYSAGGRITPDLADFEDSWQWCKYVTIRNCKAIKNTDSSFSVSRLIVAYNCEFFNFINNEGFSLKQGGGIESGIVKNNNLSSWTVMRTRSCFHPQVEMCDNIAKSAGTSSKKYDSIKSIIVDEGSQATEDDNKEVEVLEVDTDYDDLIEPTIAYSNCEFKNPATYGYLKLRKCKVDTLGIDYIN